MSSHPPHDDQSRPSFSTLASQAKKRLAELDRRRPLNAGPELSEKLARQGVSRRDFMKWSVAMTAALSLPAKFAPLTAKAAEMLNRIPVIWLHMAECTGCSESFIRTDAPTLDTLLFNHISLEYHETLMAASGWQAEENLARAQERHRGNYLLIVEGGIPTAAGGTFLTIGPHAHTGLDICRTAADGAMAIFAFGSCSSFGGVQAAYPNPTQAKALSEIIRKPVINIPGCPPSEKNMVGSLLHFILFGSLPALDLYNRPRWSYGLRVHDLCERRGRFDAGEFVERFGDEGAKLGYCLYKVGCKGPYTFNNCSRQKFNQGTSWPIQAGHGCMGCSEPDFWDVMAPLVEPRKDRLYRTVFGGRGADATADKIGLGFLTAAAVGIGAHAVYSVIKGNFRNPPPEDDKKSGKEKNSA
ncbi:hydrogenase small subunit [Desulfurivibrio dismutans]|uniref:hydrogenase small subunit n=1 Tax=Desulfurivibrio dismutans TaxID=1398908 RepID=UPI0023DC18AA|nr:hydrogenase small subunit [Desulfurivibrio alkaliphilus]MDF1615564.1 hydrogenase small subunit [Desulfurivibrio alkaliphilus]